jgi:hypothetical protein
VPGANGEILFTRFDPTVGDGVLYTINPDGTGLRPAGVNVKALSAYMGHSSITITLDRYGHLLPGNENEAAQLLDAYLARAGVEPAMAGP